MLGVLDSELQRKLEENYKDACRRAKNLVLYENPSSDFFVFIKELEDAKNEN